MSELARCPAHPAAELTAGLRGVEDRYFGLGGRYDYGRCSECGAWILSPPPSEAAVALAHRALLPPALLEAQRARARRGRPVAISGRVRARGVARQLRRLGLRLSAEHRLLEVGAGLGGFLRGMRDFTGVRVRGIEPDPDRRRFAEELQNLEVDPGPLEAALYPPGSFDLVSAWHQLEARSDPASLLQAMYRVTKPGGHLVIEAPTLGTLAERFGPYWVQLRPPAHRYLLRPSTLLSLVHQSGYEILAVRRPWMPGELAGSVLLALGLRGLAGRIEDPRRRARWALVFALTLLVDLPLTFVLTLTRSTGLIRVYARRPEHDAHARPRTPTQESPGESSAGAPATPA